MDTKPTFIKQRVVLRRFSLAMILASSSIYVQGQDTEEEDIYELSPFEVSADEQGYLATDTLSGTRMRTQIKDISSQIQVFTPEFMEDIGAVDAQEAFMYSTNLEGRLEFSQSTAGFGVINFNNDARNRGFGSSVTKSRNFFKTRLQQDGYSTERTTISSGPNSILFSRGDPAGVVDTTLKKAVTGENFGSLSYRIDDNGHNRLVFDYNKAIGEKFAIRLSSLWDRNETLQKPSADDKDGLFLTLTYRPWKGTTFRYYLENFRENSNRSNQRLSYDGASVYLDTIAANPSLAGGFDNSLATLDENGNGSISTAEINNQIRAQGFEGVLLRSGGANPDIAPNRPMFVGGRANTLADGSLPPLDMWNTNLTAVPVTFARFHGVSVVGFGTSPAIPGSDLEPLYTSNSWGYNLREIDTQTNTFSLEQQITEDFFIEVAYNKEEEFNTHFCNICGNNFHLIRVDPNQYLPDGVTPNPNLNRFYVTDRVRGGIENREWETWRAQAAYELDFTDKDSWVKNLGRHNIAFLYQEVEEEEYDLGNNRLLITDDLPVVYSDGRTPHPSPNNARNRAGIRYYLDDPRTTPNGTFGPTLDGAFPGVTDVRGPYNLTFPNGGGANVVTGTSVEPLEGDLLSEEESQVLVWQGFFDLPFGMQAVPFWGERRDTVENFDDVPASRPAIAYDGTFDFSGFQWEETPDEFKDSTVNRGIVLHATNWLSFHYNESENFGTPNGDADPFTNVTIPGEFGDGKDFGVRFGLMENRLNIRLNWFELDNRLQNGSNVDREVRNYAGDIEQAIRADQYWDGNFGDDNLGAIDPQLAGFAGGFDPIDDVGEDFGPDQWGVRKDITSEGLDAEITYNVNDNWVMKLNAGRQETITNNVTTTFIDWVNQRVPAWSAVTDRRPGSFTSGATGWENIDFDGVDENGDGLVDASAGGIPGSLADMYFENTFNSLQSGGTRSAANLFQRINLQENQNGQPIDQAIEWRVNYFTNYKFNEGRFKGFSVGGGFRYRSAPVIGHRPKNILDADGNIELNPDGTPIEVPDFTRPWEGSDELLFDLKIGYRQKIYNDKLDWKVQLNIRNLFDEDDTKAALVDTREEYFPVIFVQEMPRQLILTNTISF